MENALGQELSGDSRAIVDGLYIARRGFWTEKTAAYPEKCDGLWNTLTKGATA